LAEICKRLKHQHFSTNDEVFHYGDYGDKFYIVLVGEVSVLVPPKRKKKETVPLPASKPKKKVQPKKSTMPVKE